MLRKRLPRNLREAAERGKARFEAAKDKVTVRQRTSDDLIAEIEIEQAREWVKKHLPGIIEECSAKGDNFYCLGWCEEKKINKARRRAFACEEANLVITTSRVFELKPFKGEIDAKRDRTKITKNDIQVIVFFVLEWELIEV